ncbi:MAG: hypothetical protein LWY06_11840 [Firmicutes bacterium]|nr:hypothetical protein [Bacillota bacterium]
MQEMEYCVDASGGPYYSTGEQIQKGRVIGKNSEGVDVVSSIDGTISGVSFDGKTHCFMVKVTQENNN